MMEKEWLLHNPHLLAERNRPVEERIAPERKDVLDALRRVRERVGSEAYDTYVGSVQNVAKSGDMLLVTVRNGIQRTMLIRECADALKEAFGARYLKVVAI